MFWKKKNQRRELTPEFRLLFIMYVLHTIGKTKLEDLLLQNVKKLNLSDTIDIAILDLWFRNAHIYYKKDGCRELIDGTETGAIDFAEDFVSRFYEVNSKVDIWNGSMIVEAERRIQQAISYNDDYDKIFKEIYQKK